jgi:hypothetical protein
MDFAIDHAIDAAPPILRGIAIQYRDRDLISRQCMNDAESRNNLQDAIHYSYGCSESARITVTDLQLIL